MYQSHAELWEKKASVRCRPRRQIDDDSLIFFPIGRQPLCSHPHIIELGEVAINFILLQTFYKYLNDVITFEMDIVNKTAIKIADGSFIFPFPFECRKDAFTVVIDENYHAYASMDYMNQVMHFTNTAPLKLSSNKIELSEAIPLALESLEKQYHDGMELIAVSIAENSVTADVAELARDKTLKKSIQGLMSDHLIDEGRHAVFWTNAVKIYWQNILEHERIALGRAIAVFLQRYLIFNCYADFQNELILSLNLDQETSKNIIESFDYYIPVDCSHPMMKPIGLFLKKSGILEHKPTYEHLKHLV